MSTGAQLSGTLIPAAVVVGAAAAFKQEWMPFAIAAAALWGAFRIITGSKPLTYSEAHAPARGKKDVPGKVAREGVLDPDNYQEFPLQEKKVTSHNTAIYRFGLPKSDDILGLPIGQHISIAALVKGEEQEVVRSYTPITSDEKDKGYFDLMVKTYPTGRISRHLDELKIGDTVKFKGPKGGMRYTPNMCRRIGMIAGGTGITPMLQIIRAVLRGRSRGDKTELDLIFANVTEADILLREDLVALSKEDPGFRVHYCLDKPPPNWAGSKGFVTAEIIKGHLPPPASDIKILMCGPPPMVSGLKKVMPELGYDKPRPVSKLEDQVFSF